MRTNTFVLAACSALAVMSANAAQVPNPPQSSHLQIKQHHGTHEEVNLKAPTATSTYQTIEGSKKSSLLKAKNQSSNSKLGTLASAAATGVCNVNAFATSNSTTLITEIKHQGASCVNELFNAAANIQTAAYTSDNMNAVANHVKALSQAYSGNGDVDIEALFLYLRAGYYVEFYNNNVSFISWVKPSVKGAIDAFVSNANFYQDNDAHGKTLSEVIITMDSSEQQDVYLPVVKEWLSRWNQSYAAKWNMRSAVNGIFTILFRGQYNTNFKNLVATDTTLISRLSSFTQQSWMINSDSEYLIANAARELGRMKLYTGTAIQSSVDSGLNTIFSTYQMYGNGDAVWLGAADTASYYGNCSDYGICGYGDQLKSLALSQSYTCSSTIKLFSQNLTSVQQASACSALGLEETFFHAKIQTGNVPIPGDNNTQLYVNIFDSDIDYGKYGGPIFNIGTNNGGMYLEGDPSVATNIPNFVAYEASYAKPDHYVWNLEHEYVHYLDGRFNLYGDFNTPTEKVVWWAEGISEYVAKQNDNQAAIDTIKDGSTYTLATIFETTYDGFDVDRIYRWGYLAVRFMFENHFSEVKAMIAETRAGNWTAYKTRLNNWSANYGSEFTTWTQTVKSIPTNPPTGNVAPSAVANGAYSGGVNSAINFSSAGSIDTDGTIASYFWDFGDGVTSNSANPSHSYTSVGNYTATLTVTDNGGLSNSATAAVTISSVTDVFEITNGGSKSNLTANTGATTSSYYINVPTGATNLVVSISGGSGDADLYLQQGSEPTKANYSCRPYRSGNSETCTVAAPTTGIWYMNLNAYSTFSGVTLTASFDDAQITPNLAPVPYINGPYTGDEGVALSFSSAASYDPDGSITSYNWNFGDGVTSTLANPSHTYQSAGSFTVTLSITDDGGLTETATTTATIAAVIIPPVGNELTNGTALAISGAQDSQNAYTLQVPAGASNLSFVMNGGSGDADMYVKFGSAPTTNDYDCRPYKGGNNESCDITNIQAGTYHVMIRGYNTYNTNLTASFTSSGSVGNVPDMCAIQGAQSGGEVQDGAAICLGSTGTSWLTIGDVSAYNSMAISTGNGSGDLAIDFSNSGWPNSSNTQGSSNNSGNGECIYLTNLSQYWGYIKVSGASDGASLVVDFDTAGCR